MARLLPPQGPPKLIPSGDVLPTMHRIVNEKCAVRDEICRQLCPSVASFANTVLPIIEVEDRTSGEFTMIVLMSYASPDVESRNAAQAALKLASEARAANLARRDLFALLDSVKHNGDTLNQESRRYVDLLWGEYKRCGHGWLDKEEMQCYLEMQIDVDQLRRQYIRNITDSDNGCWLDKDHLDGIPKAYIQRYFSSRQALDDKCAFIPFRRAEMDVFLKYNNNPAIRKHVYVASSRCLEDNVALFRQVISMRHRNACVLGYANHAALKLETRMAKSPEWVETFLTRLEEELLPQGVKEMEALIAEKKQHLQASMCTDVYPDTMPPWDYPYYSRLSEETHAVNLEQISEFFPLDSVVSGLLATVASCLGLRFDMMTAEQIAGSTWHDDVFGYAVWDEKVGTGSGCIEFIGYLFMDLLSREHKYKGSQDVNLQSSYINTNGRRVYPATAIMCSFPRPAPDEVVLLKQDNIVSLFHECGHAMHDLLSRTKHTRFHGWTSPPDFNEVPSVLFENSCWMETTLRNMSCHYTALGPKYLKKWQREHPGRAPPPRQLSDSEIKRLIGTRKQHIVHWYLGQLFYSRFDMAVHSCRSLEECTDLDTTELYYALQERFRLQPVPDLADRGHPEANFTHLLKGHDAGLYSCLSAHVSAMNIFSKLFADDPMDQNAWDSYRRGLLEWGSSRDEKEVLQTLLTGSPVEVEGLVRWLQS